MMLNFYKVSGRSMEKDSIYQGDILIVDKKTSIKNHDIVVLSLPDGSLLVKHIYKKNYFYPFSASTSLSIIILKKAYRPLFDAKILGKVKAIVCNHKNKHKKIKKL